MRQVVAQIELLRESCRRHSIGLMYINFWVGLGEV